MLKYVLPLFILMAVYLSTSKSGECTPNGSKTRIALIYTDDRKQLLLGSKDYEYLVAYIDENNEIRDFFFDTFLYLGSKAPSGGSYYSGTATRDDWKWFIEKILGPEGQISRLVQAHRKICQKMGRCRKLGVIIMIPRPPVSSLDERISMVEWYIDEIFQSVKKIDYDMLDFKGFYWMSEKVNEEDWELVKNVTKMIHEKKSKLYWIPYYTAKGVDDWKSLGFDYVMLQPNFAFYDVGLERFDELTQRIKRLGISVEMELPSYKRNPRLDSWNQSFILYLYASLKYGWGNYSFISYFYGNDFVKMAKNPKLHMYYRLVYKHVKGTLTMDDINPYLENALKNFKERRRQTYLIIGIPLLLVILVIYTIYKNMKK